MWSPTRIRLIKISSIAIIALLIILSLLAGFTIYGTQVGNFVIRTDEESGVLGLSINEDYSELTDYLNAKGMTKLKDTTLDYLPDNIVEGLGSKNDDLNRYFAYSFYLLNVSDLTYDFYLEMRVVETRMGLDGAVRVMIISDDGYSVIYKKAEDSAENALHLSTEINRVYGNRYETVDFMSENIVCSERITGFEGGAVKKYTVLLWLEGYDANTTNEVIGGSLKMRLDFKVIDG